MSLRKTATLLFLIQALWLGVFAQNTGNKTITIRESRIKVKDLLQEITRQSGADFTFNPRVVELEKTISFTIEEGSLKETMELFCEKLNLGFTQIGHQIILKAAEKTQSSKSESFTLSGFLADQTSGDNMIGSTVFIKGTQVGAFTNEFGYYAISLPPGTYTVVYSHVGYDRITREITLDKSIRHDMTLNPKAYELP
ncbi:MAG: carboxypeptidase-like regulatory domain-containing protein, partial [Bacteroidetes bacterium]|nr:carboxypeptidase-like regulatory domain-containing protein [Bacteroidota bacterium]